MNDEVVVFVVDNDAAVRESIADVLRSKGLEVREFESAETFLSVFEQRGRQALILELRLPGLSGVELLEHLKAAEQVIPAVMISAFGDIPTAVKAMQAGAVTFLPKPIGPDELWGAVELALREAEQQHAADQEKQQVRQRFASLSASERQVLVRVMEGQPNKQIATELDMGLRTVELRRSHIMRKTGAASLTELIRLALVVGFPNDMPASVPSSDKLKVV